MDPLKDAFLIYNSRGKSQGLLLLTAWRSVGCEGEVDSLSGRQH